MQGGDQVQSVRVPTLAIHLQAVRDFFSFVQSALTLVTPKRPWRGTAAKLFQEETFAFTAVREAWF